jgi:hypothetical protein
MFWDERPYQLVEQAAMLSFFIINNCHCIVRNAPNGCCLICLSTILVITPPSYEQDEITVYITYGNIWYTRLSSLLSLCYPSAQKTKISSVDIERNRQVFNIIDRLEPICADDYIVVRMERSNDRNKSYGSRKKYSHNA